MSAWGELSRLAGGRVIHLIYTCLVWYRARIGWGLGFQQRGGGAAADPV
jgi:hypothetical protein